MATPPVRHSACASSLSQRGLQPFGSRLSDTTMSASTQALMIVVQSIGIFDRVASSRQSPPPLLSAATQASFEQSL
jgi:hypothetical protein